MDLLAALRTNQLEQFKQTFTWKTKEGRTVRLADMDTTHLFNTAKLLLNKFTEAQIQTLYRRGANSYACQAKNGQTIFFMVWEIENRDDLQPRYRVAYQQMITRIFDNQFIFQDLPPAIVRQRPGAPPPTPRMPLQEFARTFMGVDYGEVERRVMGQFEPPIHHNSRSEMIPIPEANRRLRELAAPSSPTAIHEDMSRLGTMAFTNDHMQDMIQRGTRGSQMDLDLWLMTVPEPFREGAQWVCEQIRRRNRHYGRRTNEAIMAFIHEFMGFKARAIAAGDLTNRGWITPAAYRTDAEREAQAREDERRGRGRRLSLEYLEMMQRAMSPAQFENELMGRLAEIPGNRPVIEEFRAMQRATSRSRMAEITAGRSEMRGRNPLLMVFDEPTYMGNLGRPPEPAQAKKEEPKIDPTQQVEQLTQIGKRKMNLGEKNDDEN